MNEKETIRTSKFLSLVLRHEPEQVGLKLGDAGWVDVEELLRAVNGHGVPLTPDQLKHIVATSDKKRFAFSEDGLRIRASQGHSVEVDLQYEPQTPPELLSTWHRNAVPGLDPQRGTQTNGAAPRTFVGRDKRHAASGRSAWQAGAAHDSFMARCTVPGHVFCRVWPTASGWWIMCRPNSSSFRQPEATIRNVAD